MQISRKIRKQAATKTLAKRMIICLFLILLLVSFIISWLMNKMLAFTVLTVIIFFGILSNNPHNFKQFIPGLTTKRWLVKFSFILLYLFLVMALISRLCV